MRVRRQLHVNMACITLCVTAAVMYYDVMVLDQFNVCVPSGQHCRQVQCASTLARRRAWRNMQSCNLYPALLGRNRRAACTQLAAPLSSLRQWLQQCAENNGVELSLHRPTEKTHHHHRTRRDRCCSSPSCTSSGVNTLTTTRVHGTAHGRARLNQRLRVQLL